MTTNQNQGNLWVLSLGNLDFMHEHEMENGYTVGVKSEDPLTASLLQARLIELGHNVAVEIVSK